MMEDEEDKKECAISKLEALSEDIDIDTKVNREVSYDFGLCNKCIHFLFVEYELGSYIAHCQPLYNNFMIKRTPQHKVLKCNHFHDKGMKTIRELYDMATIINTKEKVGFGR